MNGSGSEEANILAITQELEKHHHMQLELCNQLEHIADKLPKNIDTQECLIVSRILYPVVREAHQFEENILFPILRNPEKTQARLEQNLERLKFEHWEDESFAEDISDTLRALVDEPEKADTDKLGYMLRGFFEGLRRHIAFEVEHLLPMLRKHI